MSMLRQRFQNIVKDSAFVNKFNINKFLFCFLSKLKTETLQFKINIDTKCLVLSQYPGAETKGLGGLIAQYPKNFEILCLTNGSNLINTNPIDSAALKKQQFKDAMQTTRIKGYKIFDIDSGNLKNHYSTFKKIDISEADIIFVANIFDTNIDTISLLRHFKQLLKEKEYKKTLKIFMFESDYALSRADFYTDISSIIETKKNLLKIYYPVEKYPGLIDKITGINAFRAIQYNVNYSECFMGFSVEEFMSIPLI